MTHPCAQVDFCQKLGRRRSTVREWGEKEDAFVATVPPAMESTLAGRSLFCFLDPSPLWRTSFCRQAFAGGFGGFHGSHDVRRGQVKFATLLGGFCLIPDRLKRTNFESEVAKAAAALMVEASEPTPEAIWSYQDSSLGCC